MGSNVQRMKTTSFKNQKMDGLLKSAILLLFLGYTNAQSCDFYQNVVPGTIYGAESPRYPLSYPGGLKCRWIYRTTANNNIRLDCPEINLAQTTPCTDQVLVSRSGDTQLAVAEYYCGRGTLNGVISYGQQLVLGLVTATNTTGGRFRCQITAVPAGSTQPTTCSCGYKRTNRIVGGETTKVNEYPMMAGIAYSEAGAIKCGAVILSNRHVMTAAHCVAQRTVNDTAVIVGEHDTSTGAETSYTRGFRILSFRIHPNFNEDTYDNDVAIVTVDGTIQFSEFVGPVCLPYKFVDNSFTGAKVTLLGWGTQMIGGPASNTLRKVTVDVISQPQCQSSYPSLTSRQMCTLTPGKDACQDDSGGPVLFYDQATGREFSVGIVSYGRSCADRSPGVSTRVTALLNWITANTPADLCRVS